MSLDDVIFLQLAKEPQQALDRLRGLQRQAPDNLDYLAAEAALLLDLHRFDAAAESALTVLRRQPNRLDALNSLAIAFVETNRLDEAAAVFRHCFRLAPTDARVVANYGNFLSYRGDHELAIAAFDAAVSLAPQDNEMGVIQGMALLRAGRFAEGWAAFERRKRKPDPAELAGVPPLPSLVGPAAPDLAGRRVLLAHEQGFGDSLQMLRYVPLLAQRGARVRLRMPPALTRLAETVVGVEAVLAEEDEAAADYFAPMMGLPRLFGTDLDNLPVAIPYLHPRAEDRARWRAVLAPLPRPRIGLVWAGAPRGGLDRRRSLRFAQIEPLLREAGSFINLQIGPATADWHLPEDATGLDPTRELVDFYETAALVAELDLVVSVDTSTAHLAGALGTPVWLIDRFDSCWRWLTGRIDSPWYPGHRLFRQPAPGDWPAAIAGLVDALRRGEARPERRPPAGPGDGSRLSTV